MKSIKFDSFEITTREVIASIVIVFIMLLIGVTISNKMQESRLDRNEIYNKAVKIETSELFQYGMRTNVGSAFVSGTLEAVDPVSYPEIEGEYLYLEKVKERYTMHTRQVAHTRTVNGKTSTYYTTEIYWTWDRVGAEDIHSEQILFNEVVFAYGKIECPATSYIDTIQESSRIRYIYYGTGVEHTGTIFTTLKDGTITDQTPFYEGKTIEETHDDLLSKDWRIVFWIFWIPLTGGLVFAFYYIDNRWLY